MQWAPRGMRTYPCSKNTKRPGQGIVECSNSWFWRQRYPLERFKKNGYIQLDSKLPQLSPPRFIFHGIYIRLIMLAFADDSKPCHSLRLSFRTWNVVEARLTHFPDYTPMLSLRICWTFKLRWRIFAAIAFSYVWIRKTLPIWTGFSLT